MIRAALALVMAVSGIVAVSAQAPAEAAVSQTYLNSYELQVVRAINYQRTHRGLRPLRYTSCPDYYGERWASRLRTSSRLYHQSLYTVMRGCRATMASENIARGRMPASSLVALWMRSPGHRANILDRRATQVGVGTQCASLCTTVADFIRR
ncbi:MAG TPA: CAP domain-containing protein [Angustibacter sp.]|nr:CAP domain-containing protein [Angustibacter sp.]